MTERVISKAHQKPLSFDSSPTVEDWRTPDQKAADEALQGIWYRCKAHGLQEDCYVLAGIPYCQEEDCSEQLLVAHSGKDKDSDNSITLGSSRDREDEE